MAVEYWRSRNQLSVPGADLVPSIEDYLYFARYSIGLPYIWMTTLILDNDVSCLESMQALTTLSATCGVAMRLANDLRSFPAEQELGKLNALHLLGGGPHGSNWSEQRARQRVSQLLDEALARARREADLVQTVAGIERGFLRATEFGVELYRRSDFRTIGSDLRTG
jgi:hypothetical protein